MERYDAVILGSGPSGLTAAYCLAKQGARAVIVERGEQVGGLMRGIQRGGFALDLGRKDMHARFPEIRALWKEMLGEDYVAYPRRVGVLYDGHILETERSYKGRLRGMPLGLAASVVAAKLLSRLKPGSRTARNLEDYYRQQYGTAYYDCFVYGFRKKFDGREPSCLPAPQAPAKNGSPSVGNPRSTGKPRWYHPARGTQQITDCLAQGAQAGGVEFLLGADAIALDAEDGKVRSVLVRKDGTQRTLHTGYAIAGTPVPVLLKLLGPMVPAELRAPPKEDVGFKRSVALVYLMADGEPKFPHNWLEVTDTRLRMGRVTNYSTWRGKMVPAGKTALCLEFFSVEGDGLMELAKEQLLELAISEAAQSGLIDRARIFDHLVLKLPSANSSANYMDWHEQWISRARSYVSGIEGLLEVNRPGMDRASMAGMQAAAACATGRPMRDCSLENVTDPD
jgi:protoporphyrinogen oxidase